MSALGWPGTKNGESHRVWLPRAAQVVIADLTDNGVTSGFVFAGPRGGLSTASTVRCVTSAPSFGVERATPHDLRRTTAARSPPWPSVATPHEPHPEPQGGRQIASVYDRHGYAEETKRVMEAVAAKIMALAEGQTAFGKVLPLRSALSGDS